MSEIYNYIENLPRETTDVKSCNKFDINNILKILNEPLTSNINDLFDLDILFNLCIDRIKQNDHKYLNNVLNIGKYNKLPINLNKVTRSDTTLLSFAAYSGGTECVKLLFDYCVETKFIFDITRLDEDLTAFGRAIEWIHIDIVKLFIK